MKFKPTTEEQIFNSLITCIKNQHYKFTVDCIDFEEKNFIKSMRDSSNKVRETKCLEYAKKLAELVEC